ncbi:hypothetical protein ACFPER_06225 [Agromyces aurantiacus]|uniref:NERD domain-containing protein n=1 Tax=Agromyces aurantiacus TaxID=165814 RepID=A0ABV9R2R7_9MICO|nr:hypothetical protein [Agromyces aurantiacus]MBM7503059.1 hypothetical protein [Agromyces aurantiacus]
MPSIASRYRITLITLVAVAAALLVAGLVLAQSSVEQLVRALPDVSAGPVAAAVAAATAVALLLASLRRGAAAARASARRRALGSVHAGAVSCGIRNRDLIARLDELSRPGGRGVALPARFSIVADDAGISFWGGGSRPKRVASFPWREVRNIRSDSTVVGDASVPVAVVRIRRGGASIELPVMLSDPRMGRYALTEAPFFATVRAWKARHRAALAAEGLELPPLTGAIPVIRSGAAA